MLCAFAAADADAAFLSASASAFPLLQCCRMQCVCMCMSFGWAPFCMLRRLPGRPVLASESSAIIICSSLQQLPFIHLLLHFCNLPFALSALLMAVLLVLVVYGAQCGSSNCSSSPFCSPHWNGCTLAFCAGCDLPLRSRRFLLAVLAVPVQLQHIHTDTDSMATADQFSRRLQTYTHTLTHSAKLSLFFAFLFQVAKATAAVEEAFAHHHDIIVWRSHTAHQALTLSLWPRNSLAHSFCSILVGRVCVRPNCQCYITAAHFLSIYFFLRAISRACSLCKWSQCW